MEQSRAARCFMLVLFLLAWPDKQRGAGQSGAVFYVSVIPISVARQAAWSRAERRGVLC